ncbi:hypothetical protein G9A89_014956 [Geosiphon pyriformis]|nr:hypothetical protein G9A89_014956 [Geosiphon pyriformis]
MPKCGLTTLPKPSLPITGMMPKPFKQSLTFFKMLLTHDIIGDTEAVTTYLGCFHQNLQAIDADYFTAAQILNQFICELHSSILQHICPMHPADFQAAVIHTRDFEAAELEANHVQVINLVMNGLSKLDSKLKQFNVQPNNPEANQQLTLTNNILPATITENKLLNTIFSFELEELLIMPLFSGATLEKKLITAIYTNIKVNGHLIKLILDSRSVNSIITRQLMDQLGCRVDRAASA